MNDAAAGALVVYREEDHQKARKEAERIQNATSSVIAELETMAAEAVSGRADIEERWKRAHRQYHGVYERNILTALRDDESRSEIFINITRAKTNAWMARLGDMLFPNDERNWGIDPTPVPQMSSEAREIARQAEEFERKAQGLVDQHNEAVDEAGGEPIPSTVPQEASALIGQAKELRDKERQLQAEIELAQKRCKAMERLIDDQLTESQYPSRCRDVIEDMCKVGVGVLKGPIINDRPRKAWQAINGDDGKPSNLYRLTEDNATTPKFRRVDYWHFFPDPSAECMEDCGYTFERHIPNKKMLRRMAKEIGFNEPAVAKLLKEGPQAYSAAGDSALNFMAELREMESKSPQGTGASPLRERYLIWEYHGPLEIEQIEAMLRATGQDKEADRLAGAAALDVPMVRVFFCHETLLKIDSNYILDSGESLYSVATFEKGESRVLGGVGVPDLMSDEQSMLNSAVRMMMDNAALAVAPQVVIDKEQITPENGKWKLTPRKVWQWVTGVTTQKRERPFETFDIPMNQETLAQIIQLALRFVDEAVSMPLIAQGEMGAHVTKTSSGMSMLFNSANVGFRRVVKNWDDDVTAGTIRRTYDFNMQFAEDENVKGDMKVEARGTSVLLVRELQAEQLMGIVREWSTHPILGVGFRAYHAMRLVLQAMSINPDDLLLAEDDYLAKLKQMSENPAPDPETIRAQTAQMIAEIEAESRREVAGMNLEAARLSAQTQFAKLAMDRDISLAQIEAMFKQAVFDKTVTAGVEKEKLASGERRLAVEVAVERENKREAQAMGMMPTGSGGAVSMGAEKVSA